MMNGIRCLLTSGAALAALAGAAPAAAQYFPGYGYGAPYGRPNSQMLINECSEAVQSRLSGGYGYGAYGYGGPRVLGISHVGASGGGGISVRGVASSGRYAGFGYGAERPDLTWLCRTDFRGAIIQLNVYPAQRAYGVDYDDTYDTTPWNPYSQYGYVRY